LINFFQVTFTAHNTSFWFATSLLTILLILLMLLSRIIFLLDQLRQDVLRDLLVEAEFFINANLEIHIVGVTMVFELGYRDVLLKALSDKLASHGGEGHVTICDRYRRYF